MVINRNPLIIESRVLGIDPGLSNLGLSIIDRLNRVDINGYLYKLVFMDVIKTEKKNKKDLIDTRLTNDNLRRYIEIYNALENMVAKGFYNNIAIESISSIAIEAYMPRMQASNAWKTSIVFGGCIFWSCSHNIMPFAFLPLDLKKRFCGKKSASKFEVQEEIGKLVAGFDGAIGIKNKGDCEHLTDSSAHAILLLEELHKYRGIFTFE
jgi:Holliday junction resolvasome RuvABC endonuclease subunit